MPGGEAGLVFYVLVATGAGILGGVVAFFWKPPVGARSAIQHFAAGLVIAAVAAEVIPEVDHKGTPTGIVLGCDMHLAPRPVAHSWHAGWSVVTRVR